MTDDNNKPGMLPVAFEGSLGIEVTSTVKIKKEEDEDKPHSSISESELSACSSNFNPMKALYSDKVPIPVKNAPLYENMQQFESAQIKNDVIPVGHKLLVQEREEQKLQAKLKLERELEEKNKQRFLKYQEPGSSRGIMVPTTRKKRVNVLTRIGSSSGPLAALKDCVDRRLRVKIITRHGTGIRGVLHATLVAFDKQWNMALSDVLEVWKRKGPKKRKVPPGIGVPVPKGTAAKISAVPVVAETPIGGGIWECTRHLPQIMVRGEHVVLVNIVDR